MTRLFDLRLTRHPAYPTVLAFLFGAGNEIVGLSDFWMRQEAA